MLPTDRTIRFEVASADVIHSFWVPEFLFKLDVIPGNENGRDNVFEVTVREEGAYVGRCAELCGTYHAFMNFEVRAVSGDDYDAYLEARESGMDHRSRRSRRSASPVWRPRRRRSTSLQNASASRPTVAELRAVPYPNRPDARGGTAVKVEALIFNIIAVFCVVAAVVYGFWAQEPIGTTALVLSGGLTGLIGGFFWFVSRRIDARPEDRKDADIADGAGELGFFSPGSYWPFALALSAGTDGPGAGVLLLVADPHRRRRAADHHRRPAVRVLRRAERPAELTLAPSSPRAPSAPRGRGPRRLVRATAVGGRLRPAARAVRRTACA